MCVNDGKKKATTEPMRDGWWSNIPHEHASQPFRGNPLLPHLRGGHASASCPQPPSASSQTCPVGAKWWWCCCRVDIAYLVENGFAHRKHLLAGHGCGGGGGRSWQRRDDAMPCVCRGAEGGRREGEAAGLAQPKNSRTAGLGTWLERANNNKKKKKEESCAHYAHAMLREHACSGKEH